MIAAAARDHERLRFAYRNHDGTESRREVEPYRLVDWGRRWYLVAFDPSRTDWRTFRVDRIEPKTPNGARFTPRELPEDVTDRVRRGVSAAARCYRADVVVHAPAAEIAERVDPAVGTVEALDADTCVLHTGADTIAGLAVHIGLLDADVTVTGPPELVACMRELGDRCHKSVRSRFAEPPRHEGDDGG